MRLNPKMGDTTKQVRVDNWGIFFLQRLQTFFSKTDYCDMTLQFEGNVQLKVHKLVMNACTEYFQLLEQTCGVEDNIIMMPSDLQADVIVPIVNFMYTGMLEFQLSIFERLYKTAQLMNITILTKLLDAQKQTMNMAVKSVKKKVMETSTPLHTPQAKKIIKSTHHAELPAPLPGRKLPVWKRKTVPSSSHHQSHGSSPLLFPETKWNTNSPADPLLIPDNAPKPTRFEWPDEDLPPLNLMDTSFEDISYTSKPLLTKEEEHRATTSFDDIRQLPNANRTASTSKKQINSNLDMEEMKNYVKEQKIRSDLSHGDELVDDELEVVNSNESGIKRKAESKLSKVGVKKVKFDDQENKTTTISIATDSKNPADLDHEKIVTELLKKYPHLVKNNKKIQLKIMAKSKPSALEQSKVENIQVRSPRVKLNEPLRQVTSISKPREPDIRGEEKAPWVCERCSTEGEPLEFVLYYLYRKHMTDVHNEKFDSRMCKYCGHRCNKHNLLMYHLYTKHGIKPSAAYTFPKCDLCPYIALSPNILSKHKLRHGKNEIQCIECKLAFTSQATLTSHMQITGHTGKTNKNNYDCQYCTKRYQSGVNLFSHVRLQHRNEAIRDGIVSIDETDDLDGFDEEDSCKEEYILPEILSETEPQKKVNILSNVKVPDRREHQQRHQQLTLEPSSEAEALNNVATGIATSLGLVDIVVLNDNQQLLLPANQQDFTVDQNDQPEFILPELTGRETYAQSQNEIITTDGVITQSMLPSSDIGSTDELVMVLTDHDYGDNQEEISSENSNIVVLYSHPVDGEQNQFITSQGNLMVNSETGMIEIRNGATITSTANQVIMNPQESHIESIEMIQREIESHGELKQETIFEDENKPNVDENKEEDSETSSKEPEQVPEPHSSEVLVESLTQGQQLEFVTRPPEKEPSTNQNEENETPVATETSKEVEDQVENNECEEIIHVADESEIPPQNEENKEEKHEEENPTEENQEENPVPEELPQPEEPLLKPDEVQSEDMPETVEELPQCEQQESIPVSETITEEEPETQNPPEPEQPEDKEVVDNSNSNPDVEIPQQQQVEENKSSNDKEEDDKTTQEQHEEVEEEKNAEEVPAEAILQNDTSASQFNDENSQSSHESQDKENKKEESANMATKISILDDWEDTDSQQSDHRVEAKVPDETVNKLMDDWEEEDEEDSKKDIE